MDVVQPASSSIANCQAHFWQGDGLAGFQACNPQFFPLVTLGIQTSGGLATINISGCAAWCLMQAPHYFAAFIDGAAQAAVKAILDPAGTHNSGCTGATAFVPLAAGYHAIVFGYGGGDCLIGCDTVQSSHIDVTI